MSRYIDEHRGRFGVEPICRTLGVSAPAYYQRRRAGAPGAVEDERLLHRIRELHAANYYAYGYRRMWKALLRAGERVPRCRVQRLMRVHGIQGAKRRGKPWRTTRPDLRAQRRPDLVQRDFSADAPNRLWVADLSYLRCWEGACVLRLRARRLQPPRGGLAARLPQADHARARRSGPRSAGFRRSSSGTRRALRRGFSSRGSSWHGSSGRPRRRRGHLRCAW